MRKLLKHEWIATGRALMFVYLACVLTAGLYALCQWLDIGWLAATSTLLLFAGMAAVVVVTFTQIIQRFFRSMYGAEGYLTKTLPVSPKKLLLSKLIVSYVWLLLSYLFVFGMLALFLAYVFKSYDAFLSALDAGSGLLRLERGTLIQMGIAMLILVLIQNFTFIISIMFCITVGHLPLFNKNNGAVSFGAYVVLYSAVSTVETLLTFLIPFSLKISDGGMHFAMETIRITESMTLQNLVLPLGGTILEPILSVALFFATAYLMDKKTSVHN